MSIVMMFNIFEFSDLYHLQLLKTIMSTSATYIGSPFIVVFMETALLIFSKFSCNLLLCFRFIDGAFLFGIWVGSNSLGTLNASELPGFHCLY